MPWLGVCEDAVMARGRPLQTIVVNDEDRETLVRFTRRVKTAQALALRSRIVLRCADGATNREVARQLHVTPQTVGKWRARYIAAGLEGLLDEPRPGAPRKVTDEKVEAVV